MALSSRKINGKISKEGLIFFRSMDIQTHIIWLEDKIGISYTYMVCSSIHYSFVNDSPHLWHVNWSIPFLFPPCNCTYITGQSHILGRYSQSSESRCDVFWDYILRNCIGVNLEKNIKFCHSLFSLIVFSPVHVKTNRIHRTYFLIELFSEYLWQYTQKYYLCTLGILFVFSLLFDSLFSAIF